MILFSSLREVSREIVQVRDRDGHLVDCRMVKVAPHIWHALSLKREMTSYSILCENDRGVLSNEILSTVVNPRYWHEIWTLKITLRDHPGLLASLTDLLQKVDIDIISCRGGTTEPRGYVNFEMLLDAHRYTSNHPERIRVGHSGHSETLPEIRAQIIGTFIAWLRFHRNGPLLALRRVLPLLMADESSRGSADALPMSYRRIPIPVRLLAQIYETTAKEHPGLPRGGPDTIRVAVRADTEAGVIGILVLFPNTHHLALRIFHEDRVGTLALISEYIGTRGLNMLQLHTYRSENPAVSVTEVIVAVPPPESDVFPWLEAPTAEEIARSLKADLELVEDCCVLWAGD